MRLARMEVNFRRRSFRAVILMYVASPGKHTSGQLSLLNPLESLGGVVPHVLRPAAAFPRPGAGRAIEPESLPTREGRGLRKNSVCTYCGRAAHLTGSPSELKGGAPGMSETSPARFPVFGVMENSVLVALFCLALDFLHPAAPEDTPPDFVARGVTQDCTMTWNGLVRKYRIYIPKSYDAPDSKKAIWMGLHGSQGDQTEFYNYGWREKSDGDGFVIVLPSAYPSPTNTGIWQFHGTDTFPSKGAPRGTDWMRSEERRVG